MKRNKYSIFLEILYPIAILLLLVILGKAYKKSDTPFIEREKDLSRFLYNHSIFTTADFGYLSNYLEENNYSEYIYSNSLNISLEETYYPPFYICSNKNYQRQARPLIASIGIPREIKEQMIYDSKIFKNVLNFELNESSFKEFSSIEEMEELVKSPNYVKDKNNLICFGLKFSYENNTKQYDYSLHFFDYDKIGTEGVQDIPTNKNGMFDRFTSGPSKKYNKYKNGGYAYMMKIVNQYILRQETNNKDAKLDYVISPMRYSDFREDLDESFGILAAIFIIISYLGPICNNIYRIVREKESKIKEGMKIMGLREIEYFLSYFLQYLIISIIISFINSLLLKIVFTLIPLYIIYFTIFLWSLDIFALTYLLQSFVDKSKNAISFSLVIYFLVFTFSLICKLEKTSMAIKIILSIFCQVNLNIGMLLFNKFQFHFKRFHYYDFPKNHYNYSIQTMYIMFVFDFFVYLFLGYYFNNVFNHEFGIRKPWNFICSHNYWCNDKNKKKKFLDKNKKLEVEFQDIENNKNEIILDNKITSNNISSDNVIENNNKNDAIEIKNLVKIFEDGKEALKGINLNIYKDEIFALLGQNGAGKTTLISILTGIYEATEGEILYNGLNILESNNMNLFREKIGICSQYDILFDDLNIIEHLKMYSIFKSIPKDKIKNEINKILHDFQLETYSYVKVKNLSGGQRRKLSIAIALIGGSEIIFLDEPTSGLDIISRRNLLETLKYVCHGKIIIFTTHYMDEASLLGDKIGIISSGQIKCIGSSSYLIEKYGGFINLNVSKEEEADNNKIVEYMKSLVNNVEYEALTQEITFRIPNKISNNLIENGVEEKFDINNFFKVFDQNLNNLKIREYSVSMPTLEDVFLNLAEEDNKKNKNIKRENLIEYKEIDKILFDTNIKDNYSSKSKFFNDFFINIKRRFLIMKRDKKGFILEVICPIILILFGLLLSQAKMSLKSYPSEIDFNITGNQKIIFSSIGNNTNISSYFINDSKYVTSESLDNFGPYEYEEIIPATLDFANRIYNESKYTEDSKAYEVDMVDDSYVGYYSSLLMIKEDEINNQYQFLILLNSRVLHSIPIYSHFLLKSIIEKASGKKIKSRFVHYPLPLTDDIRDRMEKEKKVCVSFFLSIAFSILPINFIFLLVKERTDNSKHLMRISGMNIFSYWSANYIFELIKYYVTAGICILLVYAFGYYRKYFYIFYITLGPGIISFSYALSFYLNESNAQNVLIIFNFVLGDLLGIFVILIRFIDSLKTMSKIIEYIFAFLPSFCFDFSYNLLLFSVESYMADYLEEIFSYSLDVFIRRFNLLLSLVIYSIVDWIIYTILLYVIEKRTYAFNETNNKKLLSSRKDNRLIEEIEKSNIGIINNDNMMTLFDSNSDDSNNEEIKSKINEKEQFALKVNNLKKKYNNDIEVIKNLNFCVKKGECFGLLGLNGAGKTTTFKCITQEIPLNNGKIYINEEIISFEKLNDEIGYCPQFGALFENLTVYENLEFYARIKGIKKSLIKTLVNAMIKKMALDEFTNKISRNLSGGNKRKLSVAISMIGSPSLLLLDEPSTGIDPEAKRFMWSIIHNMSTRGKKSSILISTNSFEEAENLCSHIGIMINGEFICTGKPNKIKEKYGQGFEINIRIKPIDKTMLKEILKNNFNKNLIVSEDNIENILNTLGKKIFLEEIKEGKLGQKIKKSLISKENMTVEKLINWIYYVENALKFIQQGMQYFKEIILLEYFENEFLFKIKKKDDKKSIGFFFGLFEDKKEEFNIEEYSIQPYSLEKIFNDFAENHNTKKETKNENYFTNFNRNIIIDELILNKLIGI